MKNSLLVLLALLCFSILPAQTGKPYQKKVVSYVSKVLAPPSFGMTGKQLNAIASTVSNSVKFERFEYAPLPNSVIEKFSGEISGMSEYTVENVRPVIEKSLAPELMTILDINKELLSKKNLSEADRNTFLATKAQAAGLSASQLEAILNSGFFYVPYVEYYKRSTQRGEREEKNDKGKVVRKIKYTEFSHEIKVGLLWYKLNVDRSNNVSVSFIGAAQGWQEDGIQRSQQQDDGSDDDADWEAFSSAVNVASVNIGNETKKMEDFKLSGGVAEITTFGIHMTLGKREGVGLDDSYWVEEMEETESGEVKTVRRGFVKVRNVGDNKNNQSAFSYAQVITGSNYSPGLGVKEIPLLGVNGVVGFGKIPLFVSLFDNKNAKFELTEYNFGINVTEEIQDVFGPMASLQMSLANATKISELWLQIGTVVGFFDVKGKFYIPKNSNSIPPVDSVDIGLSLTGNINLGLLKKFYFRRFGIVLQADAKYSLTNFSATGKDKDNNELKYSLTHSVFGVAGKAGMEIYVTPTFSIGGGIDYTTSPENDLWNISVEDKDKNETTRDDVKGPQIKYSGVGWFAWINYSLPSLN